MMEGRVRIGVIKMKSQVANLLAADLAGARVDPNEAQKALAYLRGKKDGTLFFEYLRAINQKGDAVIRSRQTLGYYRDLLAACERHLRGMQADEMAQTLGWAIRLLRYYRAVPDAAVLMQQNQTPAPRAEAAKVAEPQPTLPEKPAAPQIPTVGEVFGGEILAIDPQGIRIRVKYLSEDIAIGVIRTEMLGGKQYQVRNIARVEVIATRTLKNGVIVLDLKPAPKKAK
jgi:hypothetical protein